ncbi:MAG: HAD family hydrolase [Gemmatimonadota bacterium]
MPELLTARLSASTQILGTAVGIRPQVRSALKAIRGKPREQRVIFLDPESGVLDTRDAHARSWHDTFVEAGYSGISLEHLTTFYRVCPQQLISLALGIPAYQSEWRRIVELHKRIYESNYVPSLRPFPGVRRLLRAMKGEGLRRVALTSARSVDACELLHRGGIADLIDDVVASPDLASWPGAELLIRGLRRQRAEARNAVLIGDTPYHSLAAVRSDVRCVALLSGGWSESALYPALAVYTDPSHLAERFAESPLASGNWRLDLM